MGRLFGTDGARGIANSELSCEIATKIGRAAASVLSERDSKRPLFVIGYDTRASSDMLTSAISAGLCSAGADVLILGVIPTPAVAYLVRKYGADAGVMISASHNPAEFNGIKIFDKNGFKLPDMLEERIETLVLDEEAALVSGKEVGRIRLASNASGDYVDHIKSLVPHSLDGLRIALDCANGASYLTAKRLFCELGASVSLLNAEPDGININEGCGSTHLDGLSNFVVENSLDCGAAFDGDADRCLFVDEKGNEIDGDMIMAIMALDMKARGTLSKDTVVGTVMTNLGFERFCENSGIHFIRAKVGDRYVLEELNLGEYSFGGEQSGHIIFRELATTGDGQLTAAMLLSRINSEKKSLSELAGAMTRYPQVTVNVNISHEGKVRFYTDNEVTEKIAYEKEKLGTSGRIVVRPSGTEPLIRIMVEGDDLGKIEKAAKEIAEVLRSRL